KSAQGGRGATDRGRAQSTTPNRNGSGERQFPAAIARSRGESGQARTGVLPEERASRTSAIQTFARHRCSVATASLSIRLIPLLTLMILPANGKRTTIPAFRY